LAFVFVAISGPLVPRLRRSRLAGAVLDGVNAASLALMGVVTAQIATSALVDRATIGLAVAAAACLFGLQVNSIWLVLGGAIVGVAMSR
jgi:chromate transporter